MSLPYYAGLTEKLTHILNSKGLSTSITSRGSLRETLVKPKDSLDKEEQIGQIYHIPCAGANSIPCPGRYVGETERTATARFQEHKSTAMNALGKYKSAMLQHARENDHHFRQEDVTTLSSETDWVKRGIKEAIFIKALKPSINIDPGRHALSSHFDSILEKIISPPPPPHNPDIEPLLNTAPRRPGRPRQSSTTTQSSHSQAPSPQSQPQPQRQSQRLRARQQQQTQ